jgi:hypothetical protein
MQRVYYGFDPYTNVIVASGESALHQGYTQKRAADQFHVPAVDGGQHRCKLNGTLGQGLNASPTASP